MASKVLQRRKKEEKKISKILVVNKEHEKLEKCPVFKVHYLGKIPARGEYGREFIDEPVETLLRLRDRQAKLPKTVLQITEKGFHFLDVNGPFGKEKHVLIPIHYVCYGVADEKNPEVFAIITRTDSNPENSLLECHAFLCDRRKIAAQITYWLLRTFLTVFEELQRRRRVRQERKLRRQQEAVLEPVSNVPRQDTGYQNNHQGYDIPPSSPTETIAPDIYSITVEGSNESGTVTAVSLTKNRPPAFGSNDSGAPLENPTRSARSSDGKKFATVPAMRYVSQEDPAGSGARRRQPVPQLYNSHETLNPHTPLRETVSTGAIPAGPAVVQRRQRNSDINAPRPTSFNGGRPSKAYPDVDLRDARPALDMEPMAMNGLSNPNAPLHHHQQEIARYQKNPRAARASAAKAPANRAPSHAGKAPVLNTNPGTLSSRGRGAGGSAADTESSFMLIQMLHDEISEMDVGESATHMAAYHHRAAGGRYPGQSRKLSANGGSTPAAAPPLDQKLGSEDIERRIREWLKRNSPDAESVAFDDTGLDRISLAGTLARHNSPRTSESRTAAPQYEPSKRSVRSRLGRTSALGTFNHMPSNGEYF